MLTSKKKCKIKSIFIEMLIFVVLLFSYPYIYRYFIYNSSKKHKYRRYNATIYGGSTFFWNINSVCCIDDIRYNTYKKNFCKSEGWTLCDFHSISILYCCSDLLLVVNGNYKNFNYCKMVCGGDN